MTNQTKVKMLLRWVVAIMLLNLCSLLALATPSAQKEQEDEARKLWNLKFKEARARTKKPADAAKAPVKAVPPPTSDKPAPKSDPTVSTMSQPSVVEGELIGVTIWRLRPATAGDDQRLLLQQLLPERAEAATTFSRRDRVRLGIEVPREGESYLYIVDREVYSDGTMSDPYLVFPLKSTRGGDNVVTAGKIVEIPARDDKPPYFDLSLPTLREDRVGERLTIIVSPQRLNFPLGDGPLRLGPAQVAQWEEQWGGPTEQREAGGSAGKESTVAEKEAGEGKRLLEQTDPLPQTIYRVGVKSGGTVLVTVPLRIVP